MSSPGQGLSLSIFFFLLYRFYTTSYKGCYLRHKFKHSKLKKCQIHGCLWVLNSPSLYLIVRRLDHGSCGQGKNPFAVLIKRELEGAQLIYPFRWIQWEGVLPLRCSQEGSMSTNHGTDMFRWHVYPYSQGLEIPMYFQRNVCWYPAFPAGLLSWVFPLPTLALRISHRVRVGSLLIWKFFFLTTPHFLFFLLFCLIRLVWGQICFMNRFPLNFGNTMRITLSSCGKAPLDTSIC